MQIISAVGRGGLIWVALALLLAAVHRFRFPNLIPLVLTLIAATTVTDKLIKPTVNRSRPYEVQAVSTIGGRPSGPSFPSGHAANAIAGAWSLSQSNPAGAPIFWVLAVAIAYSRVYLGVHYPLDVAAGGAIGLICALLVSRLWRRFSGGFSSTG
jgi:undecaprenyl-diphosphatase